LRCVSHNSSLLFFESLFCTLYLAAAALKRLPTNNPF